MGFADKIRLDRQDTLNHANIKTIPNPNGRPKKRKEDIATQSIMIRITKEQKEKLDEVAKKSGNTLAGIIKMALMEKGYI